MGRLFVPCLMIILLQFASCKNHSAIEHETFIPNTITKESYEVNEIIYSMDSPTDMAFLFDHTGSNFNPEIPAPTNDFAIYNEEEQIAAMLGVYGADMMYMKLLDQLPVAASYFQVIDNLAAKIVDSKPFIDDAINNIEKYLTTEDSIPEIIETAYSELNNFFATNDKDNLTVLTLIGGWIETMYIGIQMMQNEGLADIMTKRILQQKYSLNSIYTLLLNNQESLSSRGYLLLLKKLKKAYSNVEIKFSKEGFILDTSKKKIQSTQSYVTYPDETLTEISNLIVDIRSEIIMVK